MRQLGALRRRARRKHSWLWMGFLKKENKRSAGADWSLQDQNLTLPRQQTKNVE